MAEIEASTKRRALPIYADAFRLTFSSRITDIPGARVTPHFHKCDRSSKSRYFWKANSTSGTHRVYGYEYYPEKLSQSPTIVQKAITASFLWAFFFLFGFSRSKMTKKKIGTEGTGSLTCASLVTSAPHQSPFPCFVCDIARKPIRAATRHSCLYE